MNPSVQECRSPGIRFRPWLLLVSAALGAAVAGWSSSIVPPDFPQLVNESDYIVRAVVKSVTPELRTVPSGKQLIFSRVELDVKQVIAGHPPALLVLQLMGGKIGDREISVSDAPKFEVGREAIFFIQGNGQQVCPLVRMMHGFYPVRRDATNGREYLTRGDGKPMRNVSEVSLPIHAAVGTELTVPGSIPADSITPADFVLKIRSAATNSKLREH